MVGLNDMLCHCSKKYSGYRTGLWEKAYTTSKEHLSSPLS